MVTKSQCADILAYSALYSIFLVQHPEIVTVIHYCRFTKLVSCCIKCDKNLVEHLWNGLHKLNNSQLKYSRKTIESALSERDFPVCIVHWFQWGITHQWVTQREEWQDRNQAIRCLTKINKPRHLVFVSLSLPSHTPIPVCLVSDLYASFLLLFKT